MNKLKIIVLLAAAGLASCEKIDKPYVATTGGGDTTEVKVRKVLIEDFTGQKCGNCPGAASTIQTIKGIYGEKVLSIAVHANFYSVPAAAPYTYDFRTNEGNDYDAFFAPPNFPNGLINRRGYPSGHWKAVAKWADTVAALLAIPPDAWLEIDNSYNSTTRVLNTTIKTEFLNAMTGTFKLAVMLIEDSIVKPQYFTGPPGYDKLDYVHRHVLRDGITSSWGDIIKTGAVAAGDSVISTYQYTLPATFPATNGIAPDVNHCYVIAYIYDATTYEVIQAEEKKIQ